MFFRVKAGKHVEGTRVYTKGQTVESPRDLCRLFANKFDRVNGPDASREVASAETSAPIAAQRKADDVPPAPAPVPTAPPVSAAYPDGPLGRNVTEEYAKADLADVYVYQDGTRFFVVDQEGDGAPLHEGHLKQNQVAKFILKRMNGAE